MALLKDIFPNSAVGYFKYTENYKKKRKQPRKFRRLVKKYDEPNWQNMTRNQAWSVAQELYDGPASKVVGFRPTFNSKQEIVPGEPVVVFYDNYPR